MKHPVKWISPVVLTVLVVWVVAARHGNTAEREARDAPLPAENHVTHTAAGDPVIRLDAATQARIGLRAEALAAALLPPQAVAYGRLEEDPSRTFVVRAPVSGRVMAAAWPGIGQVVAGGAVIGSIEPRISPVDRAALQERLAAARADLAAADASLTAARSSYLRLKALNTDDKNVSDRAVEEAEARMKTDEARAAAAAQSARVIETLLSATGGSVPLVAERGGQVVEAAAQPGESVEAGQPILRIASFDRLVARVDVPVGERVPGDVKTARIAAVGYEERPLPAVRIGLAPDVAPRTQGQAFLFRLEEPAFAFRPGLAVTAYLALPGAARTGVILPRGAVVHYAAKAWAYVQTAAERFARREVALEEAAAGGWFTRSLAPATRVVSTGTQTLLSEELKSQIQVGEETPD